MFKDQVDITVTSGKGGNGMVAFRREKYLEFGGPSGGDGGDGGSIIFEANESINTLIDFSYNRHLKAENGKDGLNKNKTGARGNDAVFQVPLGTQVFIRETNELIFDFHFKGQREIIVKGGKGGRGNVSFKTHKNPAPNISENGDLGETLNLRLELKVLADVGLIGLPNAGKSTLISSISNAKPEIASYPFTTLNPHLGIVYVDDLKSFVMADLPGLISGASDGIGLGFNFLKHIERCRVLAHLISMDPLENEDPVASFHIINEELRKYNEELLKRPMVVVATKMDMPGADENFKKLKNLDYEIIPISSITKENLNTLKYKLYDLVEKEPKITLKVVERTYKMAKEEEFYVVTLADDGVYEVTGKGLEKVFNRIDFNNPDAVLRFARQLKSYGIDAELRSLGVKKGDEVRIFGYLFEMAD
ncbi:MAG: GTPase ObgE [Acholeplasmataceae bacterium]|nr:GTPase ObgE [Acholeplasmataceae bacterium]